LQTSARKFYLDLNSIQSYQSLNDMKFCQNCFKKVARFQ